ncbi:hypothetical protein SISSUDRAFT_103406 [Sistotremastrum suecicum HHB10207 ss-3]|uniref:Homeobox domain-containing protein n=1 Tax=Sistotremastrum suecicum HHB10207 ss-3 TaxID=1314776 RepID=A0A166B3L9_9AGAM|nr:hypothetical protein SISSUDRAFT_103406 [Sistotremastrum suecicum HHB10207 ss-3]
MPVQSPQPDNTLLRLSFLPSHTHLVSCCMSGSPPQRPQSPHENSSPSARSRSPSTHPALSRPLSPRPSNYPIPSTSSHRSRHRPPPISSVLAQAGPSSSSSLPQQQPNMPDISGGHRVAMVRAASSSGSDESEHDTDSPPSSPPPSGNASMQAHSPGQSETTHRTRTRTLTTPHQAAVLHALLAQSRFPTTAMREEVGRSIGMSARKVQVWFQNQRQKARRPQAESQNEPAPSGPPQYGAFPTSSRAGHMPYGSQPLGMSTTHQPYYPPGINDPPPLFTRRPMSPFPPRQDSVFLPPIQDSIHPPTLPCPISYLP